MASVLVIDDDRTIRRVVRLYFESHGWIVREAEDGDKGLVCQSSEPADVVITDMEMPGASGLDVITTLRRWGTGVPIVAISGAPSWQSMDMLKLAREYGANATLAKPFSPSEIFTVVDGLHLVDKMAGLAPDAISLGQAERTLHD